MNRINQAALFDTLNEFIPENLNWYFSGEVPDVPTEELFKTIKWLPKGIDVHGDEVSLPSPVSFESFSETFIKNKQKITYQRNRKNEYPSIEKQLDTIFHEGLDVWKEQIQAIKDKYPKPE